jgi:hypothetical protein
LTLNQKKQKLNRFLFIIVLRTGSLDHTIPALLKSINPNISFTKSNLYSKNHHVRNPENMGELPFLRKAIFDIYCKGAKGMIDTARDEGRLEGRAEGESKKAWMLQRKPLELV